MAKNKICEEAINMRSYINNAKTDVYKLTNN